MSWVFLGILMKRSIELIKILKKSNINVACIQDTKLVRTKDRINVEDLS